MSETKTLWQGDYLRIKRRGTWEYVERTTPNGMAVVLLAVTPDDEVLFVEQYRVPIDGRTIELPAGLVGDIHGDESLELAAERELEEETGWRPAHCEVLLVAPSTAGLSSERVAFVRATGLTRIHAGGGDASEDITVHAIPRAEAGAWLASKLAEGYSLDVKVWSGLWLIEHGLGG
ncbi:NUDIX hydrolase [Coralloluteibacterium stylophorae]|uniref:GDP-mannose pyrophosphatase n=1 Tax=Coralloluteibacterium stylophorae TaxID=1776034 RepID=A0A8J7VRN6_9GAMM|nr:NUDIX hydrolase [Coralloluteibacterium stylophorae]MBS7456642.1 NUDIX hydrolase [Coralloluteibacterium stylophorae]